MGNGKSQSAITYMNEHKNEKFIYITPYLDEAERIKKNCPSLNFIEPSNKISEFKFKKSVHTAWLVENGRNIATTHQAFKNYSDTLLDNIKNQGYTLIIDENVEVLELCNFDAYDLEVAEKAGIICNNNGIYTHTDEEYKGKAFKELVSLIKTRDLIRVDDESNKVLFYWTLPPSLITSFKNVFILTYLFDSQSLHHFLEIYDIPYEYIGIERDPDGTYRFGDLPGYQPEYVKYIKNKIHIFDGTLNDVGKNRYSLSMNWYKNKKKGVDRLKNNVYNYFNNIMSDIPSEDRMWGSFNGDFNKMKGKGYTKGFVTFNLKATNKYKNKKCLVYISNVFMNVCEKRFYQGYGLEVDDDRYALSVMIQWIWRSAIREGDDIYIYIPSRRMRNLLINWMDEISKEGDDSNE